MVVLAASICTKGGKAVISRQFRDMSRTRIESLLASFPKLIPTNTQHTTVETPDVRYVYQPLEDLYILLITNKASNILQDIDTLHLFARIVSDMCRSADEREILTKSFEIVGAFDEVVSMGYKETVTMMQVRSVLEIIARVRPLSTKRQKQKRSSSDAPNNSKCNAESSRDVQLREAEDADRLVMAATLLFPATRLQNPLRHLHALLLLVQPRILMPIIVVCWGASMCGMAASQSFGSLVATRFLLGLFEAGCLPLFAVITSVWYRRVEQPLRVCVWYGTNGMGTIMAAIFAYGFGSIDNPALHPYQIVFLFCGLLTVLTGPFIFWKLDNSVEDARFLSAEDRKKAIERLRANNTGTSSTEAFKWKHVIEAFLEPKTWLFLAIALCLNVGASVTTVFGPLILQSIGFDKFVTSLLNIPFGFLQIICICVGSYGAYQWKSKSVVLALLMLPVLAGLAMLYALPRGNIAPLLAAYYMLAFIYAGNPLIIAWMTANTAGSTKRSVVLSIYNAASACGNIIGPLLFTDDDAPLYKKGLKACMGLFAALIGCVILQVLNLMMLNKAKSRQRVKNGKPADIRDLSMEKKYSASAKHVADDKLETSTTGVHLGDQALLDLTDRENDEFVYVY